MRFEEEGQHEGFSTIRENPNKYQPGEWKTAPEESNWFGVNSLVD